MAAARAPPVEPPRPSIGFHADENLFGDEPSTGLELVVKAIGIRVGADRDTRRLETVGPERDYSELCPERVGANPNKPLNCGF